MKRQSAWVPSVLDIRLLAVGALGALMSLNFWSSWGGFGDSRSDTTVVRR